MEDIDELHAYAYNLKKVLGPDSSKAIEDSPEMYADADKFRILHAKARFRAIATMFGAFVGGTTVASMYMPGHRSGVHLFRAYPVPIVLGLFTSTYFLYEIHHFLAGYRPVMYQEYNYAKALRQLRNVQIKE